MNGVHDLGGMHGFGAVIREPNEPVFHSDWEKRVFALTLTAMGRRVCNVDEFRRAIERMPPAGYLAATYYEKWLHALESLLVEKGVATREEIASGHAAAPAAATTPLDDEGGGVESFDSAAVQLRFDPKFKPGFKVGDRVVARNFNPEHHTRLPRYARGKRGVIRYDQGVFVFPDTHAHGQGGKPQHVYTVAFEAQRTMGRRPYRSCLGVSRLLGGLSRARPHGCRQTGRQVPSQNDAQTYDQDRAGESRSQDAHAKGRGQGARTQACGQSTRGEARGQGTCGQARRQSFISIARAGQKGTKRAT